MARGRGFNHYYVRSVLEALKETGGATESGDSLFLSEKPAEWLKKYRPGTLRTKRLRLYTGMSGAETI